MCELENEILTAGQIQEGVSLLPSNDLQSVIPGYSSTELLLRVLIIPSFLHFPGLEINFLLLCEARLNPWYFSLHSGTEALSWSQNKPAATVQWPKSLVCRDEDSGEQGSNSRRDHQGRADHSTQSLSKASHLLWIQHRDSIMKHQNKESRNTKHLLSSGFSTEQSHLKAQKKPGSPEQKAGMCNSKPHRRESYFQRALYYKKP